MKKFLFVSLVFILLGCDPRTRIIYQEVLIPVPSECPKPDNLREPIYPVQILPQDAKPDQIAEAYVQSIKMCRTEIKIRDTILDTYRNFTVGKDDERDSK